MNKDKIKIIIVDDHNIVREGLNAILMMEDDIEVIGEASDGEELYRLLKDLKPNILLLDIFMPGKSGIEIAEEMSNDYPEIKIIILSSNIDEDSIFKSIQAGINGYLPKNVKKDELLEAIHQVNDDKEFYSDAIPTTIFKNFKKFAIVGKKLMLQHTVSLTDREKEIVRWFAEGLSYKDIAEKLSISIRTVEVHKNNIMEKLKFKTNVDLIKYAIKKGFVEL